MDRVTFVEVLDRRGRVVHRVRLDALPATLGRSYRNAVILDDRYVSPEHARLDVDPDGRLVVEDLASANGLFTEAGERVSRIALIPGALFRVGHTQLRVATTDQPVAPAVLDFAVATQGFARVSRRTLVLAFAAALGLSMLGSYLGSYGETSVAALFADALSMGAGLTAWAGAWALVTRITSQRFGFGGHLTVAAIVLLAVQVLYLIANVGDLIETGTALHEVLETALFVLALAALLYGHLAIAAPLAAARRFAWALGVAVGLVGMDKFTDFAAGGDVDRSPSFPGAVRPLAGTQGTSLDAFIAAAVELQRRVDAQVDTTAP